MGTTPIVGEGAVTKKSTMQHSCWLFSHRPFTHNDIFIYHTKETWVGKTRPNAEDGPSIGSHIPLEKNGEVNSNGIRNNVNVVVGKEKEDNPQEDNKKLYGANGII